MDNQRELTPEQKRYANHTFEQWLELPETQDFLNRLRTWAKLPAPLFYTAEEVQVYQANAITKGAYQEIIRLMQTPPYPHIESEVEQQLLDI